MIPSKPKPLEPAIATNGAFPDQPPVKVENAFTPFQWAVLNRLDATNEMLEWCCELLKEIRDRN